MSDTKKKTNGVDASASTKAPKSLHLTEKFKNLFRAVSDIKDDPEVLNYEKAIEKHATTKSDLQKREEEVNKLKARIEELDRLRASLVSDFGKHYAQLESKSRDNDKVKKDLSEAREKLKEAEEARIKLEADKSQLSEKAYSAEAAHKKIAGKLSEWEGKYGDLENDLGRLQTKVKFYGEDELERFNPEELEEKFETFADKCHEMVIGCFRDCPAPPTNICGLVQHLERAASRLGGNLPLSDSTSSPARLMRCAAAEFVITNAIREHIFTDVYIPGAVDRQRAVSVTLGLLGPPNDTRRDALVRCQLLAACEITKETLNSVRHAAANEIYTILDSLLPAGEPRNQFHAKLVNLLNQALDLWHPLQKSKHRVFTDPAIDTNLEREVDMYPEYDEAPMSEASRPGSPRSMNSQVVLLLFPAIAMNRQLICRPRALWSDQAAYVEARDMEQSQRLSLSGSMVGMPDMARPAARRRHSLNGPRQNHSPNASIVSTTTMNGRPSLQSSRRLENGVKLSGRMTPTQG